MAQNRAAAPSENMMLIAEEAFILDLCVSSIFYSSCEMRNKNSCPPH